MSTESSPTKWTIVAALAAAAVLAFLIFRSPSDDAICKHALTLVPPEHPFPPSHELCLRVLDTQSTVEMPWSFAHQKRCYLRAKDAYELHDCGGELAHLPE
jgi:hypothetical protein